MKPKLVFSILRIGTNVLYFMLIVLTIVISITCGLSMAGMAGPDNHRPVFTHEVQAFGESKAKPIVAYSADKLVKYTAISDRYKVDVEPRSVLGYFSFFATLINLGFGIAILGLFRKIFSESNLINSFKKDVHTRLVMLSVIFVSSDIIKLINYFIFNSLFKESIITPDFKLVEDIGNGLLTGLIIYAIAVIYQRGLIIQEENELTV